MGGSIAWPGRVFVLAGVVLSASCARQPSTASEASHRRLGDIMAEVGRRFERSGRAVLADRWELAAYDLGEISEVFNGDIPTAQMPEDVHLDIHPMARAFAMASLPALSHAVESRDHAGFDRAFVLAAAACNGCHTAAGKPFIEVPSAPGAEVPSVRSVGPRIPAGMP